MKRIYLIIFVINSIYCYYPSEEKPFYKTWSKRLPRQHEDSFIKIELIDSSLKAKDKDYTLYVHEEDPDEDSRFSILALLNPVGKTKFKFNCENKIPSSSGYNKYFITFKDDRLFTQSGERFPLWYFVNKTPLYIPKGYSLRLFIEKKSNVNQVNLHPEDILGIQNDSIVRIKNEEILQKRIRQDYVSPTEEMIKELELGLVSDEVVFQDLSLLLKNTASWDSNITIRYRIEPNHLSDNRKSCE
jgi:hypothetical protein